ncbi:MAG: hypothetical protein GX233_05010 [Erysipelothrix sp.]|nr:hypothetical protein [Erysipelothrix sp.]
MDKINYLVPATIIYLVLLFGIGNLFAQPGTDVLVATSIFWGFTLLGYVLISLHKE